MWTHVSRFRKAAPVIQLFGDQYGANRLSQRTVLHDHRKRSAIKSDPGRLPGIV